MITLLLINSDDLIRTAFQALLEKNALIKIIGGAGTGAEGIQLARTLQPDIVLLDIQLSDVSGIEVAHRLLAHQNSSKIIVMVTRSMHVLYPLKLLEEGAQGYLTSTKSSLEELIHAIKDVYHGERYISPDIAQQLVLINPQAKDLFLTLSGRETEVMLMTLRLMETKEIAKKLHVSSKTVHSYRGRLFQKLGIKNDMQLMLLAIRHGVINLEEISF